MRSSWHLDSRDAGHVSRTVHRRAGATRRTCDDDAVSDEQTHGGPAGEEPRPAGPAAQPPVPPGWAPQQPPAYGPAYGAASGSGWQPPAGPSGPGGPGGQQPPQGWQPPQQGWQQQGWQPPQQGWAPQPGWGQPGYPPLPPPPPKPGIIPLRPLGVGEILDGAITAMRRYWRVMIGLSAVVAAVTQVISVPVKWLLLHDVLTTASTGRSTPDEDAAVLSGALTGGGVEGVVTVLAVLVLTGILTAAVSKAVLGEPITAREAWDRARPRIPALLGVTGLVLLITLGIATVCLLPGMLLLFVGSPVAGAILVGLGALVLLVLGTHFYVAFSLAPPAVVLERQRVVASLRRSRSLVKGAWWRTFGILLLVNVIAQVLSGILGTPFQLLALGVAWASGDDMNVYALVPLLVTAVGTIIAAAITWPFTAVATTLLYVDRRMRREALDVELVRATTTPGPATPPAAGPTAEQPLHRP
jgi:hypothetical protein